MLVVMWCAGHCSRDVGTTEQAAGGVTAAVQSLRWHHVAVAAAAKLVTAVQRSRKASVSQVLVRVGAVDQTVGQSPTGRHRDDKDSNLRNASWQKSLKSRQH